MNYFIAALLWAPITPPFNCVLVRVRDHELHSSLQFTCASNRKKIERSGVYNTFLFINVSIHKCSIVKQCWGHVQLMEFPPFFNLATLPFPYQWVTSALNSYETLSNITLHVCKLQHPPSAECLNASQSELPRGRLIPAYIELRYSL